MQIKGDPPKIATELVELAEMHPLEFCVSTKSKIMLLLIALAFTVVGVLCL